MRGVAIAGLAVLLVGGPRAAATQETASHLERSDTARLAWVPRTPAEISVDGVMDEAAWHDAAEVGLPWEVAPAENGEAPVATVCRLVYDQDHLYLGCEARDPEAEAIRAFISDRDDLRGQDRIVLLLDLFDDSRRAMEFTVSALGVQGDALFSQSISSSGDPVENQRDPSWNAIWASAGRITERGYVVEAAIPFRSLRFPPVDGERTWGFRLTRWWPRAQEVQIRSVQLDRDNACDLCQMSELRGLRGITEGGGIQVTPAVTGGRTDSRQPGASGLERGSVGTDVGATLTWGVTPGITLNATVNPDFSQVEADVAQLDVNTPVALFFPETRPFFLEASDLFSTPIRALFTRTIADPSAGGKLTGKVGRMGFGFLVARDEAGTLLLPGVQTSSDATLASGPTTAVGRVVWDLGEASSVGGLYVGREGNGYSNHVGGVDAFLRPTEALRIRFQHLQSRTNYPSAIAAAHDQPEGPFSGDALQGQVSWSTAQWGVNTSFHRRTKGFRADAGFVPSVGRQGGSASLHWNLWGRRDTWFSRLGLQVGTWRNEALTGELIDGNGMWMGLEYAGPGQTSISFFPNPFFQARFAGRTYSMSSYFGGIGASPWSGVRFRVDTEWGDAIDFNNARKADNLFLAPSVELRLGRHTDLRFAYTFQRLSTGGEPIVVANLFQTRAVYNFSTRSFVRAIVQVRAADRTSELYRDPVDERNGEVFVQLLYSFKLNPESVLFVGYTDDLRAAAARLVDPLDFQRRRRSFFLKMSYAWRP